MEPSSDSEFSPGGINDNRHNNKNKKSYHQLIKAWEKSGANLIDKLEAFPRFTTKRSIARFLVKHEIFEKILRVNGSIIECGVFNGAGLFTWANFSEIYEPVNHTRKIIGFDTFAGFPSIHSEDNTLNYRSNQGDLCGDNFNSFEESIKKHNYERNLEHINKIELVRGDFLVTGKDYIKNNPHLLVSLLYLDFDLYEPTLEALKIFSPRMCKGSLIVFDELNCSNFPGETKAYLEFIQKNNLCLTRSSIDPWISWVQI